MTSILIIGGGFAGLSAAQALRKSKEHRVTLVDRKDYFEMSPSLLHLFVAPDSLGDRPWFSYRDVLGDSFIRAEVQSLEDNAAILDKGQRVAFDTLIIATGTRYPRFPIAKPLNELSLQDRKASLAAERERFKGAKAYLIVGGGLVGVELAGEISSVAPGKPIRLAHRGDRLVENLSPKASQEALTQLQSLGVKVTLNCSDAKPGPDELLYQTVSPEASTHFLTSGQGSVLDDRGRVLVDEGFKVQGHPNWYAIGDVNASNHGKQAIIATAQGGFVAQAILGGRKPFRAQAVMALVPLGERLGFAQLPFGVVKWKFFLDMKRRDYFIEKIRKELGAN